LTEPDAPTSTGEPRLHPDRPVDPKMAELLAEQNPLKRLRKTLGPGLVAAPLLVLVMLGSNNRAAMGERTNGRLLNVVGWVTTIVMGVAAVGLIVTSILG